MNLKIEKIFIYVNYHSFNRLKITKVKMKKILKHLALICSASLMFGSTAFATSYGIGVTGTIAMIDASGSETEGTAADTSDKSASVDNRAAYGSIFIESTLGNGITFGFSHNPFAADVSDSVHERTETSEAGDGEGVSGSNTRKADAEVKNYNQIYMEVPYKGSYVKVGFAQIDVNTQENALSNGGTYGNATLDGLAIGIGAKQDFGNDSYMKLSLEYVDFEDLSLSSSTNNSINADLDITELNFAIGKKF
tara:strand:+ start:742 stop:1494 length:753 start_codon:yes stop_codon:yes gene_type:complete